MKDLFLVISLFLIQICLFPMAILAALGLKIGGLQFQLRKRYLKKYRNGDFQLPAMGRAKPQLDFGL
jgi:hypothetical protein